MSKSPFTYLFIFLNLFNLSCTNNNINTPKTNNDTLYPPKQPDAQTQSNNQLIGTTVLNASEKNLESRWVHGLSLSELKSSDCMQQGETPLPTEITSIKQINNSILVITANIFANCAYNFLGEIEIVKDNTLNLIYHGYGGYASCSCCFGLTYTIELFKNEDYKFDKLKYVTINGIAKTSLPKLKR